MQKQTIDIVLASQSPRRKQLLEATEIPFRIVVADIDETPPADIHPADVPAYLASEKAKVVLGQLTRDALVIAADTIVLLQGEILGKPVNEEDACRILQKLSGNMHEVITGVCLLSRNQNISFSCTTQVYFRKITKAQIQHYVKHYKPFDKAGAYAIQEWIGMIGIEKINGDYYNVMGLPIGEIVPYLSAFMPIP